MQKKRYGFIIIVYRFPLAKPCSGAECLLVKVAKGFASTATLEKDGKSCDMRKLMALMGMGVKQGETVTIKVEGDDEEAAAEAIQKFLSENV